MTKEVENPNPQIYNMRKCRSWGNAINILNDGVDAHLVYDMEGYAKSENNTFSIFTNSNVIEISYKSSIIHKLTSVEQLDTLVEDVKKGMIEYSKKTIKVPCIKSKTI